MIKRYIASIVFLFSSLSIFLFFFIKKIPEYSIFLAEVPFELPSVIIYSIVINYFIVENWTTILIISVFVFIADLAILIALKDKTKTLGKFLIINIVLSVLFLASIVVSCLSIEPITMDMAKKLVEDRKLNEYSDDRRIANGNIDDWKIYSDEEFGFEVKYPSGWYVFDRGSVGNASDVVYITDVNLAPMISDPKFVAVGIQMLDFSVAVFINDGSYREGPRYDEEKYPVEQVLVNNIKAIKQTYFYEQEPKNINWVEVKNKDYIYVIEGGSITGDHAFDQILSTFKFIEKDGI